MVTLYYELLIKSFVLNVWDLTIKLDTIHYNSDLKIFLNSTSSELQIFIPFFLILEILNVDLLKVPTWSNILPETFPKVSNKIFFLL